MGVAAIKLDQTQTDALKELCNIGMGHATTALAKLLGKTIYFDVPKVSQVSLSQAPEIIGPPKEAVIGIYLRFSGPITGNIILIFPKKSILLLERIITGKRHKDLALDEYHTSLVKEMGNILVGSYLSVMEGLIKMRLVQSVPWFAFDLASAIIDPILIQLGQDSDEMVVVEAEFYLREGREMRGKFYLLPDPNSIKLMLNAIGL